MKVAGVHFLTEGSSKPGKTGVIVGAVVGGVASLVFLGLGIFLSARYMRRKESIKSRKYDAPHRIAQRDPLVSRLEAVAEPYIIRSNSPAPSTKISYQQDRKGVLASLSQRNSESAIESQSEFIRREVARYLAHRSSEAIAPPSYYSEARP